MRLHEEILEVMEKHLENGEYINPVFLNGVNKLIYECYEVENDNVDKLIKDMWSR